MRRGILRCRVLGIGNVEHRGGAFATRADVAMLGVELKSRGEAHAKPPKRSHSLPSITFGNRFQYLKQCFGVSAASCSPVFMAIVGASEGACRHFPVVLRRETRTLSS